MVAGRYELREQIGSGGSGTVFLAHDRVLDRQVAVKRMHAGSDDEALARLRIEARLSGLLAHPGIARVHDFGEEDADGATAPYLVMEYVDGVPLRDVLQEEGPLSPDRVMGIVAQVADALAVAHRAGIVHRDVKPSNILVRPHGAVTLIDFGIARGHDVEPVTLTGTIVGTVDYISPEQAAGAGATARSDLYALGLVAYECLTGERPLRRDTQVATVLAHVNEDVPALPRTIPEPVRDLVHRLTARDPRRRPEDAAAVARLARAALGLTMPLEVVPGPRRRRRTLAAALVATGLVMLSSCVGFAHGDADRVPTIARARSLPDATAGSPAASTLAESVSLPVVAAPTRSHATPQRHHVARGRPPQHVEKHHKPPHHGKAKGHRR